MKTYLTNCTESTAQLIDAMTEDAKEITYKELLKHVEQEQLDLIFPAYVGIEDILSLESDYAVTYYEGVYDKKPCVYVDHSMIEYIFV